MIVFRRRTGVVPRGPRVLRLRARAAGRRTGVATLALGAVLAVAAAGAGTATAAPPVVTIGFDDGTASQQAAVPILAAHGVAATFYVNSGAVGRSHALSWSALAQLEAAGHEIGGHGVRHERLPLLSVPALVAEVCGDRFALREHGFTARSFAYPFGAWTPDVAAVVQACGYAGARTTTIPDAAAETLPPAEPQAQRAFQWDASLTPGVFLDIVDAATAEGGGWVQIVLHDVCASGCDSYAITPAQLDELLTGLEARAVRFRTAGAAVAESAGPAPAAARSAATTWQPGSIETASAGSLTEQLTRRGRRRASPSPLAVTPRCGPWGCRSASSAPPARSGAR